MKCTSDIYESFYADSSTCFLGVNLSGKMVMIRGKAMGSPKGGDSDGDSGKGDLQEEAFVFCRICDTQDWNSLHVPFFQEAEGLRCEFSIEVSNFASRRGEYLLIVIFICMLRVFAIAAYLLSYFLTYCILVFVESNYLRNMIQKQDMEMKQLKKLAKKSNEKVREQQLKISKQDAKIKKSERLQKDLKPVLAAGQAISTAYVTTRKGVKFVFKGAVNFVAPGTYPEMKRNSDLTPNNRKAGDSGNKKKDSNSAVDSLVSATAKLDIKEASSK